MTPGNAAEFEAVEALFTDVASLGIRPGLERIERLLHLLGNPEATFPAIHVVGTNGKGSTCAFLDSVLRAAGYRTAFYSSPHLESPGERLLIDGSPLPAGSWMRAAERAVALLKDDAQLASDPPSYFELVTACAFFLAAEEQVDVAVVEAGLGGRLDATNLLKNVLCTLITSISMDHAEYLGDSLEKIAGEKFAVVRLEKPACFLGDNENLISLFRQQCLKVGAQPYVASWDVVLSNMAVSETGSLFDFKADGLELKRLRIGLLGRHQLANASLALLALSRLQKEFPALKEEPLREGMETARWPGRLERISDKPCVLLDGGHNLDGVIKLRDCLEELWGSQGKRVGLVYGVMRDKDYSSCLEALSVLKPAFYAVSVPEMHRALPASDLAQAAAGCSWRNFPESFDSPLEAVARAKSENDVVVICGSLYLIGWVRPKLRSLLKESGS